VEVRRATVPDLDAAAAVLGAAFADYPWTRWTVDARDHVWRITALQRLALERYGLAFGEVWLATVDDAITSVAVWMDSAATIPDAVHDGCRGEVAWLEGSRHSASVAAERELDGSRPSERHYFLATVGTVPAMQRVGIGRAVLTPVLAVADRDNVLAALETSSPSNVSFYSQLGFDVVESRTISGGGPDVWAMRRVPHHPLLHQPRSA